MYKGQGTKYKLKASCAQQAQGIFEPAVRVGAGVAEAPSGWQTVARGGAATWVGVGVAEAPCGGTPGKTQEVSEPPEVGR